MAAATSAANAGNMAVIGPGVDIGELEAVAATEVTPPGAASGAEAGADGGEASTAESIVGKIIVFRIDGIVFLVKVLRTRPAEEDLEKGMTHEIKYIHGATGTEWVKLDEANSLFSDEFGHADIEYKVYEQATAKAASSAPRGGRGRGTGRGRGSRRNAKNPWKRYKVISDRKVGILPKPDVNLDVAQHLKPGEEFDVVQEQVAMDGRKYWRLADGRGWVPECSRKDPNKIVIAPVDPPEESAATNAGETPAAAAPESAAAVATPAQAPEIEDPAAEAPEVTRGEGSEPGIAIAAIGASEAVTAVDANVAVGARWEVDPSRRERVEDSERATPKARGAGRGGAGRGRGVGKPRKVIQVGETVVVKGRFGLVTLDLRPAHSFVMVQWLNPTAGEEEEATIHTSEIKEVITAEEAAAREAAQAEAAAKAAEEVAAAAEEARKAEEEAKKAEEEAEKAPRGRGGRRKWFQGRGRGRGGSRLAGQDGEEGGGGKVDGEEAQADAGVDSDDAPLVKNSRTSRGGRLGRGKGAKCGGGGAGGDVGDEIGGASAVDAEESIGGGERRWPKDVPKFEELPEDTLPADKDIQYSALINTTASELRKMLKQIDLPTDGAKHELAIRITRELAGLPPTEADAKVFEEHEQQELAKIEKAQSKGQGKGKGKSKGKGRFVRGASLKTIGSAGKRSVEEEDGSGDEEVAGDRHGPRKADLRTFVVAFIDNSNLETARLRDLNDALEKQFGELPPKVLIRARRIAEKALVAKQEAEDAEEQEVQEEGEGAEAEAEGAVAMGEDGGADIGNVETEVQGGEGSGGGESVGGNHGSAVPDLPDVGPAEGESAKDEAEGGVRRHEAEEEGGDAEVGEEEKSGPRMREIRKHVKEFVYGVNLEAVRLRDLYDALEKKIGAMTPKTLDRVQRVTRRVIMERLEKEELKKQLSQVSIGDVSAQVEEETKAIEAQELAEPASDAQVHELEEKEAPDEAKEPDQEPIEVSTDQPREDQKDDTADSDEEDKEAEEDDEDGKSSSSSDSSSEEEKEEEDAVSKGDEKTEEKELVGEALVQDGKEQTLVPRENALVLQQPAHHAEPQTKPGVEKKPVEVEDAAQLAEPMQGQDEQRLVAETIVTASPQHRTCDASEAEDATQPAEPMQDQEKQPASVTADDAASPQRRKRDLPEAEDTTQLAEPMQNQEAQESAAVTADATSPQRRKRKLSEASTEEKHDITSPEKNEASKAAAVEEERKQSDDEEDKEVHEAEAEELQKGEKRKGKPGAAGQDKKRKLQGEKASPAAKAGLAARMSIKNVDGTLLGDLFGGGHQALGPTAAEAAQKHKLFAVSPEEEAQRKRARKLERKKQEELKQREQQEQQLIERIRGKLKLWVQECLVEDDKRQKMLDKGVLRFPIQALPSSSESFHEKMRSMVGQYGGELVLTKRQVASTPKAASVTSAEKTAMTTASAQTTRAADVVLSSAQQGDDAPKASDPGMDKVAETNVASKASGVAAESAAAPGCAPGDDAALEKLGANVEVDVQDATQEANAVTKTSVEGVEAAAPGGAPGDDAAVKALDAKVEVVVSDATQEANAVPKTSVEGVEAAAPGGAQGDDAAALKTLDAKVEVVVPDVTQEANAVPKTSAEGVEAAGPSGAQGDDAAVKTLDAKVEVPDATQEADAVQTSVEGTEAAAPAGADTANSAQEEIDVAFGSTEEAKATPKAYDMLVERPLPESTQEAGAAENQAPAGADLAAPGGAKADAAVSGTASAMTTAPGQDAAASSSGTKPPADAGAAAQPVFVSKDVWLVTFNLAAFDAFVQRHSDVVEPPTKAVRQFISDFVQKADVEALKLRDMFEALKKRFGAIRRPLLERTKVWATEAIEKKLKAAEKSRSAEANKTSRRGSEGQPVPKQFVAGGGEVDESECAQIEGLTDVSWAVAILVPWGFRHDKGASEPVLRPPARVVMPVLLGLRNLHQSKEFRELMKSTQLGKAVNCMRHHPSPEVSKVARNLVLSWRTAVTRKEERRPKPAAS